MFICIYIIAFYILLLFLYIYLSTLLLSKQVDAREEEEVTDNGNVPPSATQCELALRKAAAAQAAAVRRFGVTQYQVERAFDALSHIMQVILSRAWLHI